MVLENRASLFGKLFKNSVVSHKDFKHNTMPTAKKYSNTIILPVKLKMAAGLLAAFFPLFCLAQPNSPSEPAAPQNNIIPKPVSVSTLKGKPVPIRSGTVLIADKKFAAQAAYLQQQVAGQCGVDLSIRTQQTPKRTAVVLSYDSLLSRPEMYTLEVANNRIKIRARDTEGMVYGIQTLLQLLPLGKGEVILLPALSITDYPRFRYRGMHLDVSRHFFPVSFIKKYIDYMAFHKFNTFHWHLTDDQGWRIEIKSYPRLTEIGAWRDSTLIGHTRATPVRFDATRYGGYYTQDEIREVIRYATMRGITVIPEIDIPGHSRAAIAAYPELSTHPDSVWQVAPLWATFNRHNNVLAPHPKTFAFLKAVFSEVAGLFPAPYIHIGGDECSQIWWKADPATQSFMKTHGLRDEAALQTYFIEQVADYLKEKGKKVIGWDEILEPGLDTSAIIMNWRGVQAAITAAEKGHQVIMSPGKPLYFDFYQSRQKDSLAIGGFNPWDSVYLFEPVPALLSDKRLEHRVLGAQANVWTEYMSYPSKVEYMIFPRMTALSEVLWSPREIRDIDDFRRRLKQAAVRRYQYWQSSYFRNFLEPDVTKATSR